MSLSVLTTNVQLSVFLSIQARQVLTQACERAHQNFGFKIFPQIFSKTKTIFFPGTDATGCSCFGYMDEK